MFSEKIPSLCRIMLDALKKYIAVQWTQSQIWTWKSIGQIPATVYLSVLTYKQIKDFSKWILNPITTMKPGKGFNTVSLP